MNPQHITPISKKRRAIAPYNFIELPDENKIVLSQELPKQNSYDIKRHTGYIECTLVTESPLYIRCGLIVNDFENFGDSICNHEELSQLTLEQQKRWTDFFCNPINNLPLIPGSSLRGMFKNILEIITYSKIHQVSGQKKLFFRAVASPDKDPLTDEYKRKLCEIEKSGNFKSKVKVGYLEQQNDGQWRIYLAKTLEEQPFIWVEKSVIPHDIGLIDLNNPDYKPQYFKVRFDGIFKQKTRYLAKKVSKNDPNDQYSGYLVTSGNMIEGNTEGKSSSKISLFDRRKNKSICRN